MENRFWTLRRRGIAFLLASLLLILLAYKIHGADGRQFTATAYALTSRTATGQRPAKGIVAADPRILPLGTRIALRQAGKYSGVYTVGDTGVRGHAIDVWVPSRQEAIRFGRRKVIVVRL